jgi:hypothetical protein
MREGLKSLCKHTLCVVLEIHKPNEFGLIDLLPKKKSPLYPISIGRRLGKLLHDEKMSYNKEVGTLISDKPAV